MVAIQAIKGDSSPLRDICNLVKDIIILANKIEHVQFVHCRRSASITVDMNARETIPTCTSNGYN